MSFKGLGASVLLLACALHAEAQTCAGAHQPTPLGARIAAAALNEHREFNGHRINASGYLWKFGLAESEAELLHDPERQKADAARAGRLAWRRVWEYWLTLQRQSSEDALARKVIAVPGLLENPATGAAATQTRLRDLFSRFRADDRNTDEALRQTAVRAALNDSPWSAAFISYLMSRVELTGQQFHYSSAHWQYIKSAFERPPGYAYKACDPRRTAPRVGDLLCYSRGAFPLKNFAQWRQASQSDNFSAASHCEVVVEVNIDAKKMEVIGGNVMQSVAMRRLKLNAANRLSEVYHPERARKESNSDCLRDKACEQPNLNLQYWGVLLQLQ